LRTGAPELIARTGSAREIGGKAASLAALAASGVSIPAWFAIRSPDSALGAPPVGLDAELLDAVRTLAPNGSRLAVRSSAAEEDSVEHSFAGQYDSYLYVPPGDVAARVRDVWNAAASDRVQAYRRERGLTGPAPRPAVIVQRMVDADASGVAFTADPVSGRRGICVVAATYGVGTALVSGDVNADTFHVSRTGEIVERRIVPKNVAHRQGPDGITEVAVPDAQATRPAISDEQVRAVAALARTAERHFGRPQDIEWAIEKGQVYLLQSRPITSLPALADPDGALNLWDNSNIAESYNGITTPLTFSFARGVYEEVYRQFCRIIGVPEQRIVEQSDALRAMLGLVRGRIYYNLVSWYRILALLPGYQLNRQFMEQMMGVKEGLPPELESKITPADWRTRLSDGVAVLRMVVGLITAYNRLPRDITRFHERLERALGAGGDPSLQRADELIASYRDLERQLLTRWDAPLVNDFFAMIFYGVLRKLVVSWAGDESGTLQNDLVSGGGAIVSAEPAMRIERMAALVKNDDALLAVFCDGDMAAIRAAIAPHPELQRELDSYLATFGDRCLEELKLETTTLGDDPLLLVRAVGRVARGRRATDRAAPGPSAAVQLAPRADIRGDAERRVRAALGSRPIRRAVFGWVLRHARARVRDRENLRFERTRVFGRVRRIFVELGKRYTAVGVLEEPRDIFYLTVDEALGWAGGTSASTDLRGLASVRKAEFARYRELPTPADRFETRGMVHVGHDFITPVRASDVQHVNAPTNGAQPDGDARRGTGCYPGTVRGIARVVRDPREATLEAGEILVAERTDPGWVMLFPAASGLLVERGSLLSHSAIVARELGLPAVVAIDGLTSWLASGDEVELDGRTGDVRRIRRVQDAA
jgi:phosphohistidine swiveling domain-containing protein